MRPTSESKPQEPEPSGSAPHTNIRDYFHAVNEIATDDPTFRCEIPGGDEVLRYVNSDDFQFTNVIDQPYPDTATYLGTHYALLREDSVRPLREAVMTFRTSPLMNDDSQVAIYEKVRRIFQLINSANHEVRSTSWVSRLHIRDSQFVSASRLQDLARRFPGRTRSG